MTRHRTSAGYKEMLENGREHRAQKEQYIEASIPANTGALGWRRKRNAMGKVNEWRTFDMSLLGICTLRACSQGG